jgi:hypothetical protein
LKGAQILEKKRLFEDIPWSNKRYVIYLLAKPIKILENSNIQSDFNYFCINGVSEISNIYIISSVFPVAFYYDDIHNKEEINAFIDSIKKHEYYNILISGIIEVDVTNLARFC